MKKPVIHQLKTKGTVLDGMSYVIECSDDSIVVIDGAMYEDGDELYRYLRELCGDKDPVVDAWFITHAHPDHTYGAKAVADKYSDRITVKKMIYRFPDEEFLKNREPDCLVQIPAFENSVKLFGAEHVIPETGDRYCFGDTEFEVLFTCAELPSLEEYSNQCLNDTSLVFRIYAEGQSVLFLGDVQEAANSVMIKRHGKYLKSDVCQVAHHGCFSSTSRFYDYIDPEILLWPVSEKYFGSFVKNTYASRHVAGEMRVKDIYLHGHGTFRLELPIKARIEPFLPKVEALPEIEKKAEMEIPFSEAAPDLDDPLSGSWDCDKWREINGKIIDNRTPCKSYYKAMWRDNELYLNIRVDKSFVSEPDKWSSAWCDTARIYFTDEVVTDRNVTWSDIEDDQKGYSNIKIYAEEKNCGGKKIKNLGAGNACRSSFLVEDGRFYLTACIQMPSVHKKGDMIGLNIEVAGVAGPGEKRSYNAVSVFDNHGGHFVSSPFAIAFAKLS
ncbi:MAG: MBL fold metallo-hydrolase [Ruminococcaceae bacterium]|nr:MBL fold metallo-hydrolase [Oscillospiraceae bacterium]